MGSLKNFIFKVYLSFVKERISENPTALDTDFLSNSESILESSKEIFEKFNTEHKRFLVYKKANLLSTLEKVLIGHSYEHSIADDNENLCEQIDINAQFISIEWNVKQILKRVELLRY